MRKTRLGFKIAGIILLGLFALTMFLSKRQTTNYQNIISQEEMARLRKAISNNDLGSYKSTASLYRIISDPGASNSYDAPVKVMETRRLLVDKNISKGDLDRVLIEICNTLRRKRGYRYSKTGPTQIAIYAYTSVNSYKQDGSSWVGMLYWDKEKNCPEISYSGVYK